MLLSVLKSELMYFTHRSGLLFKQKSSAAKEEQPINYGSTDDTLPAPWKRYETAEGEAYYHNEETNETTWYKPT
jgi:hypothetical protein